jgi:hypothetical protein
MSKHGRPKTPKAKEYPPGKGVRTGHNPEDNNKLTPVWSIGIFDIEGSWGRARCEDQGHIWESIYPGLRNYETMTWNAIFSNKKHNHSVSVDDLIAAAKSLAPQGATDDAHYGTQHPGGPPRGTARGRMRKGLQVQPYQCQI